MNVIKKKYIVNTRVLSLAFFMLFTLTSCAANKQKVSIKYNGSEVKVNNKVKGVDIKTNGARVEVTNNLTESEVEFLLSGQSDNGCFIYNGSYKTTISFEGLHLKSTEGAAIELNCGKRINVNLKKGSENYLEDGTDTLHKACINTKGHLELNGSGNLHIVAHSKYGIKSKEYIEVKQAGNVTIESDNAGGINSGSTLNILGGKFEIISSGIDTKGLTSDSTMTLSNCSVVIRMTGDGGKGVKCDGDLIIDGATLDVKTIGNYVSITDGFGGMGGPGEFGGGIPNFGNAENFDGDNSNFRGPRGFGGPRGEMNDSTIQRMMEEGRKRFEEMMGSEMPDFGRMGGPGGFGGGMPDFGRMGGPGGFGGFGGRGENNIEISDSVRQLLFADVENDVRMGFGGKRKYNGSAKAVKVMGKIVMNSGSVIIETATAGAEGLEGKQGIEINGGKLWIKAADDGISSNGQIIFNCGEIFVWSTGNDAIDSNSRQSGAITINGGSVIACSQPGSPEEAIDCDFSPFILTGGTVFGMGGSMGGESTAPTLDSNTQPTVLLSGLPCPKGKTLIATDAQGKEIFSFDIPFTMQQSSSILSLPEFKQGNTYTVKIKEPDVTLKQFTFDEVIVR